MLLTRLLAVTATTATLLGGVAAPAFATPDPCPGGEATCLYVNGFSIPVGTPTISPTGVHPSPIPGPVVCDSNGGNCHQSYFVLEGVTVATSGVTLATIDVPGFGIGYNGLQSTVYFSEPSVSGGSGQLGAVVKLYVPVSPFYLEGTSPNCAMYHNLEPVTVQGGRMCTVVVTIAV